jgi:HEAT repeat protein
MSPAQLDLFRDFGAALVGPSVAPGARSSIKPAALDDDGLVAALASPDHTESLALLAEAARRRLAAAVPHLRSRCRRHAGFGGCRPIPEQIAALDALRAIGTREATLAVAEAIERGWVEGPGLAVATRCAGRLRANLPAEAVAKLLQHPNPSVRAAACGCARPLPPIISLLGELMADPHRSVAEAAACALGRLGRAEARPMLTALLEKAPSEEVIEALGAVADGSSMVLLGRIARSGSMLAPAALAALADIDHPRAAKIRAAAMLQHERSPASDRPGNSAEEEIRDETAVTTQTEAPGSPRPMAHGGLASALQRNGRDPRCG